MRDQPHGKSESRERSPGGSSAGRRSVMARLNPTRGDFGTFGRIAAVFMVAWCLGGQGWEPPPVYGATQGSTVVEVGAASFGDGVLAKVGAKRTISTDDLVRASRMSADSLTPESARRFLDLLVDRELLAEQASAERWTWTEAESSGFEALHDRLIMAAALDSLFQATRARLHAAGGPELDALDLGMLVRDSLVAELDLACDQSVLDRLARAWAALPRPESDSSAAAQVSMLKANPRVAAADSNAVVARSKTGEVLVGEILESWRRLSPAYRMRIESASQIRDLVANALFEHVLRERARLGGFERRPTIAAALARARDEIGIAHLLARDVFGTIHPDRVRLERHYGASRDRWTLPLRVRVLQLSTTTRVEADRLALRLRSTAEAETLRALARRAGLPYESEWTADGEGKAFQKALAAGPGIVLGPDPIDGGFRVTRIFEALPSRVPPFEEVRARVQADWTADEAERLTRQICERAKRRVGVRINGPAIARLGTPSAKSLAGER
jgi:hypothetical protein